jgi:hypothetical protein
MKVEVNNAMKFHETGFLLIEFRASFAKKKKIMGNVAPLLTNVWNSYVYDINIGLIKVVV